MSEHASIYEQSREPLHLQVASVMWRRIGLHDRKDCVAIRKDLLSYAPPRHGMTPATGPGAHARS